MISCGPALGTGHESKVRMQLVACPLHSAQRTPFCPCRSRHCFVDDMINRSLDHWTTTCYDKYQRCWLGIL